MAFNYEFSVIERLDIHLHEALPPPPMPWDEAYHQTDVQPIQPIILQDDSDDDDDDDGDRDYQPSRWRQAQLTHINGHAGNQEESDDEETESGGMDDTDRGENGNETGSTETTEDRRASSVEQEDNHDQDEEEVTEG